MEQTEKFFGGLYHNSTTFFSFIVRRHRATSHGVTSLMASCLCFGGWFTGHLSASHGQSDSKHMDFIVFKAQHQKVDLIRDV